MARHVLRNYAQDSEGNVVAGVTYKVYPHATSQAALSWSTTEGRWEVDTALLPAPSSIFAVSNPANNTKITSLKSEVSGYSRDRYIDSGIYTVIGTIGNRKFVIPYYEAGTIIQVGLGNTILEGDDLETALAKVVAKLESLEGKQYPTFAALIAADLTGNDLVCTGMHHSIMYLGGATYYRTGVTGAAGTESTGNEITFYDATRAQFAIRVYKNIFPEMCGAELNNAAFDSQPALQMCTSYSIAEKKAVALSAGNYYVNSGILEAQNNGQLTIEGAGPRRSVIKVMAGNSAADQVANGTLPFTVLETGLATGQHNAYRNLFREFSIDCNSRDDMHKAIVAHEGGLSRYINLRLIHADDALLSSAATGAVFEGGDVSLCNRGVTFSKGGGKSSPSNTSKIKNTWFANTNQPIFVEGGGAHIDTIVLQSCGDVGDTHLVTLYNLDNSGSAAKFAASSIRNVWAEGGTYKYCFNVSGCQNTLVESNFISLSGDAVGVWKEGAILIDAPHCTVRGNSIYQGAEKPVQDGRLDNAGVYFTENCKVSGISLYTCEGNSINMGGAGRNYYHHGEENPTVSRDRSRAAFAYVSLAAGVPTIEVGKNVTVNPSATGGYSVSLPYNRDSRDTEVIVVPKSSGHTPLIPTIRELTDQALQVKFWNLAGAEEDPDGFTVEIKGAIGIF